ncbi:cytosolic enolase 3 [Citrus sinensis]|nr:cytosolic enolase 3 [Citrus sinensis]
MRKAVPSVITKIKARQILDSRGIPTVEVDLFTHKGMFRASVPSGDPSGMYEALELRDGDKGTYLGNSVNRAVKNINERISEALVGMDPILQLKLKALCFLACIILQGELGANAILAVSIAACKAGAVPLYKHIADLAGKTNLTLPVPAFTVISGGKHAGNNLAIQDIMILPIGASSFGEALQMGSETYHHLKAVIAEKYGAHGCNVGEDGDYPIVSIEDPFDKEDWEHTKSTARVTLQVVGDDLLMSNPKRIERAIHDSTCNALLLKINQIGTVTEAIEVVKLANDVPWGVVISHRSGETEDSFIIKAGAPCRGERLAKYNQLLHIEEELGDHAIYAGEDYRQCL